MKRQGIAVLTGGASRPHTIDAASDSDTAERLRALVQRTPRDFGHPTRLWTLELAVEVAHAEGITATRLSLEKQ
mgnify:CR=1 FL=1